MRRLVPLVLFITGIVLASTITPAAAATPMPEWCKSPYTINERIVRAVPGKTTHGTARREVIIGTSGADRIEGHGGNDTICGEGGNDTILTGDSNDFIYGGDGNDLIKAADGDDSIYPGNGNDVVYSGSGDDNFWTGGWMDGGDAGGGDDKIYGEAGIDFIRAGAGNDFVDLGDGGSYAEGIENAKGGSGNDILKSIGRGIQWLDGENGDDLLIALTPAGDLDELHNVDQLWSGDGNDIGLAFDGRTDTYTKGAPGASLQIPYVGCTPGWAQDIKGTTTVSASCPLGFGEVTVGFKDGQVTEVEAGIFGGILRMSVSELETWRKTRRAASDICVCDPRYNVALGDHVV